MSSYINWKIFFILLGLCLISVVCVFPYVLTVQGDVIRQIGQPIGLLFFAQMAQSLILFSFAIFFGLFFTKRINFQLPLIEAILEKGNYRDILRAILAKSILAGTAVAISIYAADALFSFSGASISTHQSIAPIWQKLLAALYGGTTEEILMRLFLMSFFVWLGMKMLRRNQPSRAMIIVSIVLAAIIFGLGHLPITASLTKLDALIITRAVVLNCIGGIIFGWLFWKKGLESAMIAHFTADIFLLTILPYLLR